jgi:hypothetical protein
MSIRSSKRPSSHRSPGAQLRKISRNSKKIKKSVRTGRMRLPGRIRAHGRMRGPYWRY